MAPAAAAFTGFDIVDMIALMSLAESMGLLGNPALKALTKLGSAKTWSMNPLKPQEVACRVLSLTAQAGTEFAMS
jgi:hypothetical protein